MRANLWIANLGGTTVKKLRPSDGAVLAPYPVHDPYVLAYDGANLWATDCNAQAVTKIRALARRDDPRELSREKLQRCSSS